MIKKKEAEEIETEFQGERNIRETLGSKLQALVNDKQQLQSLLVDDMTCTFFSKEQFQLIVLQQNTSNRPLGNFTTFMRLCFISLQMRFNNLVWSICQLFEILVALIESI